MNLPATPLTAACAAAFPAIARPMLWARLGGSGSAFDVGLVAGTLLLVGLPAHAFVLGFSREGRAAPGTFDAALLTRGGAWVAAAMATVAVRALVGAAWRGSPERGERPIAPRRYSAAWMHPGD